VVLTEWAVALEHPHSLRPAMALALLGVARLCRISPFALLLRDFPPSPGVREHPRGGNCGGNFVAAAAVAAGAPPARPELGLAPPVLEAALAWLAPAYRSPGA
jgi:hypothetical protein